MRASDQDSTGTAALSYVEGDFRRLGWGPIPNAFHDLGTDLFIQVRDERRFDRGLIVGAQVKGGHSWFQQPAIDDDGNTRGWWFYEPSVDHFDDWVTHGLPHLVVLHDFVRRESYWVHVTAERCIVTGKGCKILVPKSQTVDPAHRDALLDVARAQRAASSYEQRAFHASAGTAPPARRMRYALLTPRLIAPHGNAGFERAPEPEEYLALLIRRRTSQVAQFRRKHPEVLNSDKLKSHSDWRWRFAHAVSEWLESDDISAIDSARATAPNPAAGAAASAMIAAHYVEAGNHQYGLRTLSEQIKLDTCAPVDLAWLLVHSAAIKVELGDVSEARIDAAKAAHNLRGDEDDPTAALLAGVAASILFTTAGFGGGDLEDVVNSNDTAPAWWRAQLLSWALGHFDDDAFADWVSDDDLQLSMSEAGQEHLEASRLNALLASDHQAWRSISARQARSLVRQAHRAGDELRVLQGLDQLRRAGDSDKLAGAVSVVWQSGPLSILRDVVDLAGPESLTRSTAATAIRLWGQAADALEETKANNLAAWCVAVLARDPSTQDLHDRFGSAFAIDSPVLQTLKQLMPLSSVTVRERVAGLVIALPHQSVDAQQWAGLVYRVGEDAFKSLSVDAIFAKAVDVKDHLLKDALLYQLACWGDERASAILIERSRQDLIALQLIPNRDELDEELVRASVNTLVQHTTRVRSDAAKGRFGFFGVDAAYLLIGFNLLHSGVADWDAVFDFLGDPNVLADHKEDAVARLAGHFSELDASLRERIEAVLPTLTSAKFSPFNARPRATEAAWELQILTERSESAQHAAVAQLLSGTPAQRRVAARLLGAGVAPKLVGAVYALLGNENRRVRASAAFALGGLLARAPDIDPWLPAINLLARDDGAMGPTSLLAGLSAIPFSGSPTLIAELEPLKRHGSHRVRRAIYCFEAQVQPPKA